MVIKQQTPEQPISQDIITREIRKQFQVKTKTKNMTKVVFKGKFTAIKVNK